MISPERINFLVFRIMEALKEKGMADERFRKAVRTALEEGFEVLEQIKSEVRRNLSERGLREGESGWRREFKVEYERKIRLRLRNLDIENFS